MKIHFDFRYWTKSKTFLVFQRNVCVRLVFLYIYIYKKGLLRSLHESDTSVENRVSLLYFIWYVFWFFFLSIFSQAHGKIARRAKKKKKKTSRIFDVYYFYHIAHNSNVACDMECDPASYYTLAIIIYYLQWRLLIRRRSSWHAAFQ